jgi:hypothetical protein
LRKNRLPLYVSAKASFNMSSNEIKKNHDPLTGEEPGATPRKDLPAAAVRALEEAAQRRKAHAEVGAKEADRPKELGGPKGDEPTRYGDWERGGRAVDF